MTNKKFGAAVVVAGADDGDAEVEGFEGLASIGDDEVESVGVAGGAGDAESVFEGGWDKAGFGPFAEALMGTLGLWH
jgi:hypothetical protein